MLSHLRGRPRAWRSCPEWLLGWSRTARGWLKEAELCSTPDLRPQTHGSYAQYPNAHTHTHTRTYENRGIIQTHFTHVPFRSWWKQRQSVPPEQKSKLLLQWSGKFGHSLLSSSAPTILCRLTEEHVWLEYLCFLVYLTTARLHLLHDLLWFVVKKMLFLWPLHGRKRGRENTQTINYCGFQKCLSEVHTDTPGHFCLFGKKAFFFFFHTANILLFPDCGLKKNDFADSWFALTASARSLCSPSRPQPEWQLWPFSAATVFPQCDTDDHTLKLQPHVTSGGQTKVSP